MQITILRHGKPDFEFNQNIKGSEIGSLIKAYDYAGIIDTPPENLKSLANQHNYVVCSDLPRSIQSAKAVGAKQIHLSDPVFRGMNIPYSSNMKIKLPIQVWVVILRVLWFLGY